MLSIFRKPGWRLTPVAVLIACSVAAFASAVCMSLQWMLGTSVTDVSSTLPVLLTGTVTGVVTFVVTVLSRLLHQERERTASLQSRIEQQDASEERLRRVLRAGRIVTWECDLQSRLVTQRLAPEVFGLGSCDAPLTLKGALSYVYSEDRSVVLDRVRSAIRHREPFIQQFRIVVKRSHEPLWVENHCTVECDGQSRPVRLCGTLIDVTAHRRALDALSAADRRKDVFLATIAHELRNPLAAIRMASQILETMELDDTRATSCIRMVRRQAGHLARLLEDLMDISRIAQDKLELRRARIDLRIVLAEAVEATRHLIEAQRHDFQISELPHPIFVDADEVRLVQVFWNLLTNAAKYTPAGGRIRVTVALQGRSVSVSIRDSGIGIAPDKLPHIFKAFYQADTSNPRSTGGLGIGLALVRRLVELHGGHIEAHSQGPDSGAEFRVYLPVIAQHQIDRCPIT